MRKSIGIKIWLTMIITFLAFILIFILINATVIQNIKEAYIFDQLQGASESQKSRNNLLEPQEGDFDVLWAPHFKLSQTQSGFELGIDKFTRERYSNKGNIAVISLISEKVIENPSLINGQVKNEKEWIYYYVDWYEDHQSAMIFLASSPIEPLFNGRTIFVLVALMIISSIAARMVALNLIKPIKKLENFANEVAKRNWKCEMPSMDPDEIGNLADSLDEMKNALMLAEEKERRFLQMASHDLKTPVMIIKGYAQAVIDGVTIEGINSFPETVKFESLKLERRISQLLNYNILDQTLEHDEMRESIQLDRMLRRLVEKFRIVAPQIEWEMSLEPAMINGKMDALLTAFENIFDNQIRFSRKWVRVALIKEDELIKITILNDGPQINDSLMTTIFDPYSKDKEGQFGLGLAIAYKVFKSHHASIEAENQPNGVAFNIFIKDENVKNMKS